MCPRWACWHPRLVFSAYIASKSALDAFSRCVRAEVLDKNVQFTTINMPLVRTPMINPVSFYEHVPALTPDEAGRHDCRGDYRQNPNGLPHGSAYSRR